MNNFTFWIIILTRANAYSIISSLSMVIIAICVRLYCSSLLLTLGTAIFGTKSGYPINMFIPLAKGVSFMYERIVYWSEVYVEIGLYFSWTTMCNPLYVLKYRNEGSIFKFVKVARHIKSFKVLAKRCITKRRIEFFNSRA